jgi:NAD(P)-dependent dehydrogenase (short-subunit alcohol dehydrogenase family)
MSAASPSIAPVLPEGTVALVTGAGSGMGQASAREFAAAGARVVVADVNPDAAAETVRSIEEQGGLARVHVVDVSDEEQCRDMVAATVDAYGRLDYAVNNAALRPDTKGFLDCDLAEFHRILSVDLVGVMLCLKYELAQMVAQGGGAIVNMGSIRSIRALPTGPAYTAATHGVLGLSRAAAALHAADGIRVNTVCPGTIETPMVQAARAARGQSREDQAASASLFHRLGTPQEIAAAVVWLCSPASSFVTGLDVVVDGGALLV